MSKKNTRELLKELDKRIENVKESKEFKEMLDFFSKFHSYSYHNTILIQMQKPDATHVAGYKQWQDKFNRQVKKGEKGISILAPYTYQKEIKEIEEVEVDGEIMETEVEKKVTKTYFKSVYVFDISQTEPIDEDGEIPKIDISLKNHEDKLLKPLTEFATSHGLEVVYRNLSEGEKGYLKKGKIVVSEYLSDTEKSAVLAHELAHALLDHANDNLSREIKEMEAEAVSFIVMKHYDIEIKSDKYLVLYKKEYDLEKSLKRIHNASTKIIEYCDKWLADKKEKEITV